MIKCWGLVYPNVQSLWEDPRCYASTYESLKHRLRTMPPEKAVLLDDINFFGKHCTSIANLHREVGDSMSLATLYRRLGCCYRGKKVTVMQAISPVIWKRIRTEIGGIPKD